jgi:hypothetical protein
MATFPALKPATRRYSMGVYPVTEERGFGGGSVRFRHGATAYGHTLELGFVALTAANAKLLRDHYRTQQGGYLTFPLSAEAWSDHASTTDLVPATTYWRYASPIQETFLPNGFREVTVSLIAVPLITEQVVPGTVKVITASIVGGSASGA